uniref:COP9 signalosome complex subunit 5a (Fragments) n=1 Tax=Brassica oleracea TaxID=3712 RepID=CSN5A_BRAOL|nr:RecName: Full=COP9 signalosome complex subunit 5a; Short=Signalosome subunit 5a; AltName: Full=Jun activation domain-binding homolog 2 [Brassica oleracea]
KNILTVEQPDSSSSDGIFYYDEASKRVQISALAL